MDDTPECSASSCSEPGGCGGHCCRVRPVLTAVARRQTLSTALEPLRVPAAAGGFDGASAGDRAPSMFRALSEPSSISQLRLRAIALGARCWDDHHFTGGETEAQVVVPARVTLSGEVGAGPALEAAELLMCCRDLTFSRPWGLSYPPFCGGEKGAQRGRHLREAAQLVSAGLGVTSGLPPALLRLPGPVYSEREAGLTDSLDTSGCAGGGGSAVAFPGAEGAGGRASQEAAVFVILLTKTDHRPF